MGGRPACLHQCVDSNRLHKLTDDPCWWRVKSLRLALMVVRLGVLSPTHTLIRSLLYEVGQCKAEDGALKTGPDLAFCASSVGTWLPLRGWSLPLRSLTAHSVGFSVAYLDQESPANERQGPPGRGKTWHRPHVPTCSC